jgi:hypothetical protein
LSFCAASPFKIDSTIHRSQRRMAIQFTKAPALDYGTRLTAFKINYRSTDLRSVKIQFN